MFVVSFICQNGHRNNQKRKRRKAYCVRETGADRGARYRNLFQGRLPSMTV